MHAGAAPRLPPCHNSQAWMPRCRSWPSAAQQLPISCPIALYCTQQLPSSCPIALYCTLQQQQLRQYTLHPKQTGQGLNLDPKTVYSEPQASSLQPWQQGRQEWVQNC